LQLEALEASTHVLSVPPEVLEEVMHDLDGDDVSIEGGREGRRAGRER
jgi:hypothetical protein